MARTERNTVDYFPHDANASEGDTLTVLQSRHGNNGYAFWFKLLEKLASAEGHYLDCRNPIKWNLLLAKTGVDEITGVDIMKLLVEMQAIDKTLWESRLIWCQKLVDNIADVYKNRKRETPQKPLTTIDMPITTADNGVTKPEIPQSKVNKSKVNKSKVNQANNSPSNNKLPDWLNKETWDAFLEMRKEKKAVPTAHAKELLIRELGKFRLVGNDPTEVLNRSIMNGWKGIFPLDKQGGQNGVNQGRTEKGITRRLGYAESIGAPLFDEHGRPL